MSRNKLYSERLELCLTPEQYSKLKQLAEKEDLTMNHLVREVLKAFLNNL